MNYYILCIDIVSFVAITIASRLTLKTYRHPIYVVCVWWTAFIALTNFVVIGEGVEFGTHLLMLLFCYSILVSGIIFEALIIPRCYEVPKLIKQRRRHFKIFAISIFAITIVLGYNGYKLQQEYGVEYRNLTFATGDYTSLLYKSYYLQVISALFLAPCVFFGVIAFPVMAVYYGKIKFMAIGLLFTVAVSLQGASRGQLYYFVLATILSLVYVRKVKTTLWYGLICVTIACSILMLDISKNRLGSDRIDTNVTEEAIGQFINYHVIGGYLLNHEFKNGESRLHTESSYGRISLFAYPDTLLCMFLRRIGVSLSPAIDRMAEHWQTNVYLGNTESGRRVETNAFYTSIYPLYYDFGFLGVVLVPGILAYYLVLHTKAFRIYHNVTSLLVIVFMSIFFLTSIFGSKLSSIEFIGIFYCILFLKPIRKQGNINLGVEFLRRRRFEKDLSRKVGGGDLAEGACGRIR